MADDRISFQALQLANKQRSSNGLRYNDFTRYRKHCANRTHRLRSTLKLTHGKGREFKKLPSLKTDSIKDGHLELFLSEAERAWAYSQDLIAQSILPANKAHSGTLRHSATGRFRRAVHWSTQLLSYCQALYAASRLSAENLVQVTIYILILNGRFLRHRDDLDDALIQLSVARNLLDELADQATTSRDQALAALFSDDIAPEIRYCAHELGRKSAYDVDSIVSELGVKHRGDLVEGCESLLQMLKQEGQGSDRAETRKRLEALMWEGQPIPVRNPELVDILLKVQEAAVRITASRDGGREGSKGTQTSKTTKNPSSKGGVAAYDAVLSALSDAEQVARTLMEAQQGETHNVASATGTRDIQFMHGYIVYQLLSHRIQRDLLLISALLYPLMPHGPAKVYKERVDGRLYPAVVKLLDTVVQGFTQMRSLAIVEESPDLSSAVEARLTYTKARRCLYLSRCYVAIKQYGEALMLLQHATLHVRETRIALPTMSGTSTALDLSCPLPSDAIDTLESDIAEASLSVKNEWFSFNGGTINGHPKTYKKPVFFDIALNYVQQDMDKLLERARKTANREKEGEREVQVQPTKSRQEQVVRAETPEPPQIKGLSSLLGGWWGRR